MVLGKLEKVVECLNRTLEIWVGKGGADSLGRLFEMKGGLQAGRISVIWAVRTMWLTATTPV